MKVEKKDLSKSQIELTVEFSVEEFSPYLEYGAREVSKEVKIDGFRPGKASYNALKAKVGEMTIMESAARIAINKNFPKIISENLVDVEPAGQPRVDIVKLAPGNPVEFKILLAILPQVTIGVYKELKIKPEVIKIEEKEVENTIKSIRESRAKEKLVERESHSGDKVIIDLEMFLDKVPVEGGQTKGTAIELGKDYFIPGFDKEISNMKKGEIRDFKLPYPKDFHQKNLAGKMVEFRVVMGDVFERELPLADDELAKNFGLKTLAELEKNIKDGIEREKKHEAERRTEAKLIEEIVKKAKFSDIPDVLIESETETMFNELTSNLESRGGRLEDYLSSINKTRDQLKLEFVAGAIKRIKSALLIKEIARTEKIMASEEDIDKKRDDLLIQYKGYQKVEERLKNKEYRAVLRNILINEKVVENLKKWNLEK